jgi:thioredoxin reductase (NADPH)
MLPILHKHYVVPVHTTEHMTDKSEYEVVVVGGGPAGLTAALYATRLGHDAVVIDRGGGRAAMMLDTHNVIGVTEEASGNEFLATAVEQIESYGGEYARGMVSAVDFAESSDRRFAVETGGGHVYADRLVFATGFNDRRPDPPLPRTGRGLHYCLHCDAYLFVDEPTYVMGHGESAAHVAMLMVNFTPDVDLLLNGDEPTWSEETDRQLRGHPVEVVPEEVTAIAREDDSAWLAGFEFADDSTREYRGGFAMYGAAYNNDLPESLGCAINDDGTVVVDDHCRTTVEGVYAVGDLTPDHNQIPVAMGEGAKAGIAIHKELRTFPRSLEEIEAHGPVAPSEVPATSEQIRAAARTHRATGDD